MKQDLINSFDFRTQIKRKRENEIEVKVFSQIMTKQIRFHYFFSYFFLFNKINLYNKYVCTKYVYLIKIDIIITIRSKLFFFYKILILLYQLFSYFKI